MIKIKCVKCDEEALFDAPDNFCDEHWAEWWVEGIKPERKRQQEYRKALELMRTRKKER